LSFGIFHMIIFIFCKVATWNAHVIILVCMNFVLLVFHDKKNAIALSSIVDSANIFSFNFRHWHLSLVIGNW
jgi:hypothetical protein